MVSSVVICVKRGPVGHPSAREFLAHRPGRFEIVPPVHTSRCGCNICTWKLFFCNTGKHSRSSFRNYATSSAESRRGAELLFRGQSDSSWPLTTTLERAGREGMSFDEYYRLTVHRVRPTLETLTGPTWDVPDYDLAMEKAFRTDRELFFSRGSLP